MKISIKFNSFIEVILPICTYLIHGPYYYTYMFVLNLKINTLRVSIKINRGITC